MKKGKTSTFLTIILLAIFVLSANKSWLEEVFNLKVHPGYEILVDDFEKEKENVENEQSEVYEILSFFVNNQVYYQEIKELPEFHIISWIGIVNPPSSPPPEGLLC